MGHSTRRKARAAPASTARRDADDETPVDATPERRGRRPMLPVRSDTIDHEIVSLFFRVMEQFKDHVLEAARALGLSLPQVHLLMTLREPAAMRDIAEEIGFDASHVTGLVDRLEDQGLVERHTDPRDRRVKRIHLTDEGAQVRDRIEDRLFETIPPLRNLTAEQRVQLRDLLAAASA